jgi:hypothetical protein
MKETRGKEDDKARGDDKHAVDLIGDFGKAIRFLLSPSCCFMRSLYKWRNQREPEQVLTTTFLVQLWALTREMVKTTSIEPSPYIAGVLMISDDTIDRFYEAEIAAADLRIEDVVGTVKKFEKAGRYREASSSREFLALLTKAQEFRRLRHQRMQAMRHPTH